MAGGSIYGGSTGGGGGSIYGGSGGGGGTAPLYQRVGPHAPAATGGGSSFLGNLGSDIVGMFRGFPQGIQLTAGALWHDIKTPGPALKLLMGDAQGAHEDFAHPGRSSHFLRDIVEPIGAQYKYQYSPLLHGDVGEFGSRFHEHPLGPILDLATIASLGSAGAVKAGTAVSRVAPESALARYAEGVNAPRMIDVNIGDATRVPIEIRKARTPYGRAINNLVDVLGTRYQEAPLIGNIRRDIKLYGRDVHQARSAHIAQIRPFERSIRPLTSDERFAYHLAFEGRSPKVAFDAALEAHDLQPALQLRKYMERLAGKRWSSIENDIARGVDPMLGSRVSAVVAHPRPELVDAINAGKVLEEAGGQTLMQAGVLLPEIREARKWLARRLESGARFDEGRTPTAAALGAQKQVDTLAKRHDRILSQIEKDKAKAQVKVDRLEAERARLEIKGNIHDGTARQRLAELDSIYEEQIAAIERQLTGGVWDPAEHGRRMMENRITRGKAGRMSVKKEIRGMAEERFWNALEEPALAELRAAMEERQRLSELLNDPDRVFGSAELTPAEKGRLTSLTNRIDRLRAGDANRLTQHPRAASAERLGSALSVARGRLERMNLEHRDPGFVGGKTIEELRATREGEIAGRTPTDVSPEFGSPARFPHEATQSRENPALAAQGQRAPTRMPGAPASTKRNRGVRMLAARLVTDPTQLSRDYLRSMGHRLVLDFHEEMKSRAIPLDTELGGNPRDGFVYFRHGDVPVSRAVRESDPIMRDRFVKDPAERSRAMAKDELDRLPKQIVWERGGVWPDDVEFKSVEALTEAGVWQIPERYAKQFLRETHQSGTFMRNVFDKPLDIWRAIVLTYRPAWLVNNIVGQHFLYFLNHAGLAGARAYLRALQLEKGDDPIKLLGRWTVGHKPRSKWGRVIDEVRPGYSFGGFFRSQEFGQGGMYLGEGRLGAAAERAAERPAYRPSRIAYSTLRGMGRTVRAFGDAMNWANLHVADDLPRRAAFLREAERSPMVKRVKAQIKDFQGANATLEQAIRGADEKTVNHLVDEVNRALGNFAQLGPIERNYVRRLVPFYSWFKTISLITGGLAMDHPGRLLMLQLMAEAAGDGRGGLAGPMPSYLEGGLPLSGAENGEQTIATTMAINPFETPIALGEALKSLIPTTRYTETGAKDVSSRGTGSIFGLLNPVVGAGMAAAGRDIFYGSDYRGPGAGRGPVAQFFGYFGGLPQFRLAEQLGAYGDYQSSLYNTGYKYHGVSPFIWNYLGLPVRRVRLNEARTRAEAGQ